LLVVVQAKSYFLLLIIYTVAGINITVQMT
jgi:hypothetical protein